MSKTRVLVWEDFPESASEWHDKHQAEVAAKLCAQSHFWHCIDNPFSGLVPPLTDPFLTIYEVPDTTDYEALEAKVHLDPATTPSFVLKGARFDSRCYTEVKRIKKDNYDAERPNLGCLVVVTWRPHKDTKDAMFNWFFNEFMPGLMADPLHISVAVYRRTHATVFENGAYRLATEDETLDYVTVCESTCEELPWEVLVALGQTDGWRKHLDGDTMWRVAQYSLQKWIPDNGIADTGDDTFEDDSTEAEGPGHL